MQSLHQLLALLTLICALAVSTYAGEMPNGIPSPGEIPNDVTSIGEIPNMETILRLLTLGAL